MYHEEADAVIELVMKKAMTTRRNILYDTTMKNGANAIKNIKTFKGLGYRTEVAFADLPLDKSVHRAMGRFLGRAGGEGGRFVDPAYIVTHARKNLASLEGIKKHVDVWRHWNTDVPKGSLAKLVAQGGKELKPVYTPAKSLRAAERMARETLGLSKLSYRPPAEFGIETTAWKTSGQKTAALNKINKEAARLTHQFPTMQTPDGMFVVKTSRGFGTTKIDGPSTSFVPRTVAWRRNEIRAMKEWEKVEGVKWGHSVSPAANVRHEIAHTIMDKEIYQRAKEVQVILTTRRQSLKKVVGNYGAKNAHEMASEAFAQYTAPNYVKGTLPTELEDLVETMLGMSR